MDRGDSRIRLRRYGSDDAKSIDRKILQHSHIARQSRAATGIRRRNYQNRRSLHRGRSARCIRTPSLSKRDKRHIRVALPLQRTGCAPGANSCPATQHNTRRGQAAFARTAVYVIHADA